MAVGAAALIAAGGWLAVDVAAAPSPAAGEGPALLPAAATASPTPTTAAEPDEGAVVAATAAALEDWASFAGSGDLGDVEATFDTAGPQYRQLAAENAVTGGAYGFDLGDYPQVTTLDGDYARVRTTVAFTTAADTTTYDWELELRREPEAGGVWRLWTVHEASP